jgi:hypothetical protein
MIAACYSAIHRPPDGARDQLDPAILIDIMPMLMHGISSGIIIDRPRPEAKCAGSFARPQEGMGIVEKILKPLDRQSGTFRHVAQQGAENRKPRLNPRPYKRPSVSRVLPD